MGCVRALAAGGMRMGHVGHLVQVPRHDAAEAAATAPDNWTVFSHTKAQEAAAAARAAGREQALLARLHAPGDTFYTGHEGGFGADDVLAVADALGSASTERASPGSPPSRRSSTTTTGGRSRRRPTWPRSSGPPAAALRRP